MTSRPTRLLGTLGGVLLIAAVAILAFQFVPARNHRPPSDVAGRSAEPTATPSPSPIRTRRIAAKRGDTLVSLHRKYHVPLSQLLLLNHMTRSTKLVVGKLVIIPVPPAAPPGLARIPGVPPSAGLASPPANASPSSGPAPTADPQPTAATPSQPGTTPPTAPATQAPTAPGIPGPSPSLWSWFSFIVGGTAGLALGCVVAFAALLRAKRVRADSAGSHTAAARGDGNGMSDRAVPDPRRAEPLAPLSHGPGPGAGPAPAYQNRRDQPEAQAADRPAVLTMVSGTVDVKLIDTGAEKSWSTGLSEFGYAHTAIEPEGYAIFDDSIIVPVQICASGYDRLLPGQEIRLRR